MNKKMLIPVGVIALITASGVAYAAYAYQGDPAQRGPQFSTERHEQMQKAFENNDYNAWKEIMNGRGRRMMEVVNEQNFPRFAQMHRLMLEGKYDDANKIREELGLKQINSKESIGARGNQGWRNGNKSFGCPMSGRL